MRSRWKVALIGATVLGGVVGAPAVAGATGGAGHTRNSVLYVSSGTDPSTGCRNAAYQTVQSAVDAAHAGDAVVVCSGTYAESVTIGTSITLRGQHGATIDATGQAYGIGVTVSGATIQGLTVENATAETGGPGDGIITAGFGPTGPVPADHITITGNKTINNEGAGIDLNSSSWSTAAFNVSTNNGIGINVSDDLGAAASHNSIIGNITNDNPGGCGIVLADHSGLGIFSNQVIGNQADDNGLGSPSAPDASAGSGIILAGGSGGVYNNLVAGNEFAGNGHAGVAIHAHAPGMNLSGNTITLNRIGTNNLRTDFADPSSTGVYIGDVDPLTITVVGNIIHDDDIGIFTAGPITVKGSGTNLYRHVTTHTSGVATYAG